jgi:hypothetical protein
MTVPEPSFSPHLSPVRIIKNRRVQGTQVQIPPSPQRSPSWAVRAGDSGRLNQHEGLFPPVPRPSQAQPNKRSSGRKRRVRTSEDTELMTQCNRLKNEVSPDGQDRADPLRGGQKELNHRRVSLAGSGAIINDSSWTGLWRTTSARIATFSEGPKAGALSPQRSTAFGTRRARGTTCVQAARRSYR